MTAATSQDVDGTKLWQLPTNGMEKPFLSLPILGPGSTWESQEHPTSSPFRVGTDSSNTFLLVIRIFCPLAISLGRKGNCTGILDT